MLPTSDTRPLFSERLSIDWRGYRHALASTVYALLLVLVMLLPANFVAFALCTTLYHGGALEGARFAAVHRISGYWMGADVGATQVGAVMWWVAALCEALFWASCASAIIVFALWIGRAATERLRPRTFHFAQRRAHPAQAA